MKWLEIWRFLRGYGIIRLQGCRFESMAEALRAQDIPVWDVRREKDGAHFCTTRRGVRVARQIWEQKKRGVLQSEMCGRYAVLAGLRRRLAFLIAFLCMLTLLCAALGLIWRVDVQGVPAAYRTQALLIAQDFLPRLPAGRMHIDKQALRDALMLRIPQLSWAQASFDGVTLALQAQLRTQAPQILGGGTGNVVAQCDAIISSIAVTSGTACVEKGDVVHAGDVLIRGIAGREGYERDVCARGQILGRVWYEKCVDVPFDALDTQTGRTDAAQTLLLGPWQIALRAFDADFASYREQSSTVYIPSLGMGVFAAVRTDTRFETQRAPQQVLLVRARQTALSQTLLLAGEDAQIVDTDFQEHITGGGVHICCTLTAEQTLGVLQEVYAQ